MPPTDKQLVFVRFDGAARSTRTPLTRELPEMHTLRDAPVTAVDIYYRHTAAIMEASGG